MDIDAILQKAAALLSPFETEHVLDYLRHLTARGALENPWLVVAVALMVFYALIARSRAAIGIIFGFLSLLLITQFTLPKEGAPLSLTSTMPFVLSGIATGVVLIYLFFIRED